MPCVCHEHHNLKHGRRDEVQWMLYTMLPLYSVQHMCYAHNPNLCQKTWNLQAVHSVLKRQLL